MCGWLVRFFGRQGGGRKREGRLRVWHKTQRPAHHRMRAVYMYVHMPPLLGGACQCRRDLTGQASKQASKQRSPCSSHEHRHRRLTARCFENTSPPSSPSPLHGPPLPPSHAPMHGNSPRTRLCSQSIELQGEGGEGKDTSKWKRVRGEEAVAATHTFRSSPPSGPLSVRCEGLKAQKDEGTSAQEA